MPPENGVTARSGSTFEDDFREFNGRPPTPEETRKHLAFDRLAKTSSLDPATLLLIVNASRSDQETLAAKLDRIDARLKKTPPSGTPSVITASARDLLIVAATIAIMVVVAVAFGSAAAPVTVLFAVFALGVGATLAYTYLEPILRRR